MQNNWQCHFKNLPKTITVGKKFNLFCDGETKKVFKPPLKIEFFNKNHNYSLYVLDTVDIGDNFFILDLTSYRTGTFNHPFKITDGVESLEVKDLSWTIQSVIQETKKSPKPYSHFGPFYPTPPIIYLFFLSLSAICFLSLIFVFLKRFIKRKRFLKKVLKRKTHLHPSKSFILGLRGITNLNSQKKLEDLFKTFLEDKFLIPAHNQTTAKILKNLKKYHFLTYQKAGQDIKQVLNEFLALNQKEEYNQKTFLKLKKICQNIVFLLDKPNKAK